MPRLRKTGEHVFVYFRDHSHCDGGLAPAATCKVSGWVVEDTEDSILIAAWEVENAAELNADNRTTFRIIKQPGMEIRRKERAVVKKRTASRPALP